MKTDYEKRIKRRKSLIQHVEEDRGGRDEGEMTFVEEERKEQRMLVCRAGRWFLPRLADWVLAFLVHAWAATLIT